MSLIDRIPIEKLREVDPNVKDLTDEQLLQLRDSCYGIAELAFEKWVEKKLKDLST